MPFKIVRNDIAKMDVDAVVNCANPEPIYSCGVDTAIYLAAGEEKLLQERKKIGHLNEGEVAITQGFDLLAKYIIHAVSPPYKKDDRKFEKKLRSCYKKSLELAKKYKLNSIAFPVLSTGSYGCPMEEGMRIALDEINAFLMKNDMLIYLVVFGTNSTKLGLNLYPQLEAYIDHNYVCGKRLLEYGTAYACTMLPASASFPKYKKDRDQLENFLKNRMKGITEKLGKSKSKTVEKQSLDDLTDEMYEENEHALEERLNHLSDTFQEYLLYKIKQKKLSNYEVYKNSIVTKQTFSKIKRNKNYHPDKFTALRLCIGAQLNLDEAKDLLLKAGYALSDCDKRDIIFSFFIEKEIYDIYEIDIALEKYGLSCSIS